MINDKRYVPRIKLNAKVRFDFSDMDEENLKCAKNAFEADIVDISIQGIGLRIFNDVGEDVLDQVFTGKKKVRLNFKFSSDGKPINTFATLVRYASDKNIFGLKYIDIPADSYAELKNSLSKFTVC